MRLMRPVVMAFFVADNEAQSVADRLYRKQYGL